MEYREVLSSEVGEVNSPTAPWFRAIYKRESKRPERKLQRTLEMTQEGILLRKAEEVETPEESMALKRNREKGNNC